MNKINFCWVFHVTTLFKSAIKFKYLFLNGHITNHVMSCSLFNPKNVRNYVIFVIKFIFAKLWYWEPWESLNIIVRMYLIVCCVCYCCIYFPRCLFYFIFILLDFCIFIFIFYVCFYFNNALGCVLMKTINEFETENQISFD